MNESTLASIGDLNLYHHYSLPKWNCAPTQAGSEIPVVGGLTGRHCETPWSAAGIAGSRPSLLGRDWLSTLQLDWYSMFATWLEDTMVDITQRHEAVFWEGLSKTKGTQATLHISSDVKPKLPHALRSIRLKRSSTVLKPVRDVIIPVQHSDWAAPIVPVLKSDGSVRICGDFKLTANVATRSEIYPLPRIDDLFASLAGGQHFSKLDLLHAYLQSPLAEEYQPIGCDCVCIVFNWLSYYDWLIE